jgi:hypothetical protein
MLQKVSAWEERRKRKEGRKEGKKKGKFETCFEIVDRQQLLKQSRLLPPRSRIQLSRYLPWEDRNPNAVAFESG